MCFVIVIAKHMRWGRQEDAHEFLRYVVDALQRAALVGLSKYVIILLSASQSVMFVVATLYCCVLPYFSLCL